MIDEERFYNIEDLDGEVWAPIEGFPDYEVSTFGRVKSYKRKEPIILKLSLNKGYYHVNLLLNGVRKTINIHRLVGKTFISNPENLLEINHIDENKLNNHADNLEWCSRSYNINYGSRTKKAAKKLSNTLTEKGTFDRIKKQSIPIKCLETGQVFYSMGEAARQLNIYKTKISQCIRNGKSHSGYTFEKVDPNSIDWEEAIKNRIK